jgi:hypothetical protein
MATIFSSIGLVLDIIGGVMLFFYGFPVAIDFGEISSGKESSSVKTHVLAKIGLGFLVLGFVFQLMGTVMHL